MRGVNPPLMINRRAGVFFVVSDVLGGSSANSSDSAGVDGHTSVKRSDVKKILKIRPEFKSKNIVSSIMLQGGF